MDNAIALPLRQSALAEAWASLTRHKGALVGAAILMVIVAMALFSSWIAPYDPFAQIPWEARRGPLTHFDGSGRFVLLGTDHLGRDLLSRIVYASRVTLIVSFTAVVISGFIGVVLGVAAGYLGRWFDAVCMRLVDIFLAFPFELLALSIVAVTGPSLPVVWW
jgi:ABC-type dipeptide/oligopeptide/nickel transport system permease subunit